MLTTIVLVLNFEPCDVILSSGLITHPSRCHKTRQLRGRPQGREHRHMGGVVGVLSRTHRRYTSCPSPSRSDPGHPVR